MKTAHDIVQLIGHRNLADMLGVVDTAVSNAVARGMFPAKWYRIVKSECVKIDVDCPDELFNFLEYSEDAA